MKKMSHELLQESFLQLRVSEAVEIMLRGTARHSSEFDAVHVILRQVWQAYWERLDVVSLGLGACHHDVRVTWMIDAVGHEQSHSHALLFGLGGEELGGVGYGVRRVRSLADVDSIIQSTQEHVEVLPVSKGLTDVHNAAVVDERKASFKVPVGHLHLRNPFAEGSDEFFLTLKQIQFCALWAVQNIYDLQWTQ